MTYVALPDVHSDKSIQRFGQIQKLVFQRTLDPDNEFVELDDIHLKATWTAAKAAVDETKVVCSPLISEPENEAGEPREYGGGNATLNGIPILLGIDASPFTCKILEHTQRVIAELKKLVTEARLSVYLINEHGQIGCLKTETGHRGIPIRSFYVGDKRFGNFEEVDSNELRFHMAGNWSDDFDVVTPDDFDALTYLTGDHDPS